MNTDSRIITINEPFTIEMSGRIAGRIYELSLESAKPIVFAINSKGGNIRALHTIIAAINAISCKIITITMGIAASCAAMLFLQGEERIMLEGSEILFYEPRNTYDNRVLTYTDIKRELEDIKVEYDFFISEIARVTGISKSKVAKKIKQDYLLSAQQAIQAQVATRIITKFSELDIIMRALKN